jgi:predicted TIM-barrel fold metal-dependent hydrolase
VTTSALGIEVVDAQVHLAMLPSVEAALTAMDALGISGLIIDEFYRFKMELHGVLHPSGKVYRINHDYSKAAVAAHPDRFRYLHHIDPDDPEMDEIVAEAKSDPGMVGLRVVPSIHPDGFARFDNGDWATLFRSAEKYDVPVFCSVGGRAPALASYATQFPSLKMVMDHTGLLSRDPNPPPLEERWKPVAELAKLPNVALKWGHAPRVAAGEQYPYPTTMRFLLKAVEAFGPQRVHFASDHTMTFSHHTWAESFFYILTSSELSREDKEWVLGKGIRQWVGWPAPEAQEPTPAAH